MTKNNPFQDQQNDQPAKTEIVQNTEKNLLAPFNMDQKLADALNGAVLLLPEGAKIQLVPAGSKGIIIKKEFNQEIQTRIEEVTIELQQIKAVTTQEGAAKANVSLKKAKSLINALDAERKLMTSVLDEEKKDTMSYENSIVSELQAHVTFLNNFLTKFQEEEYKKQQAIEKKIREEKEAEEKKQRDEIARVAKIKNIILEFEKNVMNAIHTATIENVDEKIRHLSNVKLTEATYMEFLPEAQDMYNTCVGRFNVRRGDLINLAKLEAENKEQADKLKAHQLETQQREKKEQQQREIEQQQATETQTQEALSNIQMEAELKTSQLPQQKGVQKRWVFDEENVDMKLLPLEYHTFDKEKIKEAIANGARTGSIPGVIIFEKIINVSK